MAVTPYAVGPGWAPAVAPLVFIGLALLRGARQRRLRVNRLWIMPLLLIAAAGSAFAAQAMPGPGALAVDAAALAIGAGLGWQRGRLTRIAVDDATGALTSQASQWGLVLVALLFAVRFGLRGYLTAHAVEWHVKVSDLTDAFLLFAVGLVVTQRLEMWIRARRLLEDHAAGKSTVS